MAKPREDVVVGWGIRSSDERRASTEPLFCRACRRERGRFLRRIAAGD
jgi:hypothetical protein